MNFYSIQNKIWLNKNTPPSSWSQLPYYEYTYMVNEWIQTIEKENEVREKQLKEEEAMKSRMMSTSRSKTPKYKR